MTAGGTRARSLRIDDEVVPHSWSGRGVRPTRVAVLADGADPPGALIGWASTSSHELVLAVQLLEEAGTGAAGPGAAGPVAAGPVAARGSEALTAALDAGAQRRLPTPRPFG